MKRIFVLLTGVLCFFSLFVSCVLSWREPEEYPIDNSEKYMAGDMSVYEARYNLRIVNKTNTDVTIYGPGVFYQDNTGINLSNVANEEFCLIEADGEVTSEFTWYPKHSLYYSDDPDNQNFSTEDIKAEFNPTTASFYFKFAFEEDENDDVYIVGWPQNIELPTEAKEEWDIIIPRERVVRYGFGYAENKEVRTKDGFAYIPFIIKATELPEYDFDSVYTVYGNAVLVINAANNISFETSSLSAEENP